MTENEILTKKYAPYSGAVVLLTNDDRNEEEAVSLFRSYSRDFGGNVFAGGRANTLDQVKHIIYAGCERVVFDLSQPGTIEEIPEASLKFGADRLCVYVPEGFSGRDAIFRASEHISLFMSDDEDTAELVNDISGMDCEILTDVPESVSANEGAASDEGDMAGTEAGAEPGGGIEAGNESGIEAGKEAELGLDAGAGAAAAAGLDAGAEAEIPAEPEDSGLAEAEAVSEPELKGVLKTESMTEPEFAEVAEAAEPDFGTEYLSEDEPISEDEIEEDAVSVPDWFSQSLETATPFSELEPKAGTIAEPGPELNNEPESRFDIEDEFEPEFAGEPEHEFVIEDGLEQGEKNAREDMVAPIRLSSVTEDEDFDDYSEDAGFDEDDSYDDSYDDDSFDGYTDDFDDETEKNAAAVGASLTPVSSDAVPKGEITWEDLVKNESGLIPVIVIDHENKDLLMMAWMDREAYEKTLETGLMTYHSRSRNALWVKGETSGHYQKMVSLTADCDLDALTAEVYQTGAACHTGNRSCFFNVIRQSGDSMAENKAPVSSDAAGALSGDRDRFVADAAVLLRDLDVINDRRQNPKEGSYTNYLFAQGLDKILKKVGEETSEVLIAAKNGSKDETIYEIGDLLYHLMVLMSNEEITWEDVFRELKNRENERKG